MSVDTYVAKRPCFGKAVGEAIVLDEAEGQARAAMGDVERLADAIGAKLRRQMRLLAFHIAGNTEREMRRVAAETVRQELITESWKKFGEVLKEEILGGLTGPEPGKRRELTPELASAIFKSMTEMDADEPLQPRRRRRI